MFVYEIDFSKKKSEAIQVLLTKSERKNQV